jgi:RNA-directed DNA polymerase
VKFVEHRVGDRRIVRLIQKWLGAGVLEDGKRIRSEVGAVQGGSISPLLANLYMHYVFDLWVHPWRKTRAHGDVIVVRFADDFVVGFQHRQEAEQFLVELRERFSHFGLELHPDKTRLIEFGRFAGRDRRKRGDGKPETFHFLGFTHMCGKSRNGWFKVLRQTMRERMRAKLHEVKIALRRRMHAPVPEQGSWLASVVRGHFQYYGVPGNQPALSTFRQAILWMWRKALRHRSQTAHATWERMKRLASRWLPPVRLHHPYPNQRLVV